MLHSTLETTRLNRRIQAYLRGHAMRMPDHERFGPFLAGFDPGDDNPYRNYAVPDDDAIPTGDQIAQLIAGFARRKRKPRLEYIAESAPDVEAALLTQGFIPERRYPIMIATVRQLRPADVAGVVIEVSRDDSDIVAAADVGALAYGNDAANFDALRRLTADKGILMIARDVATRRVVGLGMATPQYDRVTEIAGIGVLHSHRGRGIAGALTSSLTSAALREGAEIAWLTPGHDGAERAYARAGFVRASEQLHISKPVAF